MKDVTVIVLRNLFLSVAFGLLVWFLSHSALLPVTEADDGYGHGPDKGSGEWKGAIIRLTEEYQREAKEDGVIGGILAFAGLTLVSVQGHRYLWRLHFRCLRRLHLRKE